MNAEVQHLANNERYRILVIDGETYIMDIESSFWKIIFPFFFWLLPNHVFKVDDQEIEEQLQAEKMERRGISGMTSVVGISYAGGISLVPLMDYFNVYIPPLVIISLLVVALILVGLLYFSLSRNREKKLYDVVKLKALPKKKIWIRPSSIKHFLNVLMSYIFFLGFNIFGFWMYLQFRNVMVLIIVSLLLFIFLLINRKTIREGNATVKVKA